MCCFFFYLDYRSDTQKANLSDFFFLNLSSKWVVKQRRQLTTSIMHLAQELLTNVQCSGGSRSFTKEMRALKLRSVVAGHQKLTMTIVSHHWSWSSYNYMRSCQRIQHPPFCGHSAFKANCCSVAKLCSTLYDTMDCSMPGFPVLHKLPESAQTHVHWVSDATWPSHPLLPPSPPALNLS